MTTQKKKRKAPRQKRYTVALSECEMRRLTAYAAATGASRPAALARLVRQSLRQCAAVPKDAVDKKQLCLFDSLQIDIFNNTTVVNNKEQV